MDRIFVIETFNLLKNINYWARHQMRLGGFGLSEMATGWEIGRTCPAGDPAGISGPVYPPRHFRPLPVRACNKCLT
jgi:hypothetical protein